LGQTTITATLAASSLFLSRTISATLTVENEFINNSAFVLTPVSTSDRFYPDSSPINTLPDFTIAIKPSPTTTQTGMGGSITVRYLQYTVHLPKATSYTDLNDLNNTWNIRFDLFKKNISSNGTITWIGVDQFFTTMPGYEADGSTLSWRNTYDTTSLDDTDEIQTNILVGTFRVKAKYENNSHHESSMVHEGQVKYSKEFTYYR
jgi:hypothetical protein